MMGKGQGHVILSNQAVDDELYFSVLGICIHEIASMPSEFEEAYESLMNGLPRLKQLLTAKEEVSFEEQELWNFQEMANGLSPLKLKKWKVHLSENLKKTQKNWDFYL